jgi:WD40 repeat protein
MNLYGRVVLVSCFSFVTSSSSFAQPAATNQQGVDSLGDTLPVGARLRLGTLRLSHGHFVGSVAFSSDGKVLATTDANRVLSLWEVTSGRLLRQLSGQSGGHAGGPAVFSPDGQAIASGDGATNLYIWEVATGKELAKYRGKGWSTSRAFSPDGKVLALAGYDKSLVLLEWATGKELCRLAGQKERAERVAFAPDGKALAAACGDGTVRVWELPSGKELKQFLGHKGWVHTVAFSPDGGLIASGGSDHSIRLWDVATGQELRQCTGHEDQIWEVQFSPDGKHLASGGWGTSQVNLWDVTTGKLVRKYGEQPIGRKVTSSICSCVAFSPDGKLLAGRGRSDQRVVVWDVATGREVHEFVGHTSPVNLLAPSPDGKVLASASNADEVIRLWDLASGRRLRTLPGNKGGVAALAYSPDGKCLAAANVLDQAITVWDPTTGKQLQQLPAPALPANASRLFGNIYRKDVALAFSPDGSTLAAGHFNGQVYLWDVASGRRLTSFQAIPDFVDADGDAHSVMVSLLTFLPDGKEIVVGSIADTTYHICDVGTGRGIRRLQPRPPDKPRNVGYSFWDVSLALSPDGKTVAGAGGCMDQSIRLWETATGQERRQLGGPGRPVHAVAIAPDGRTLASWRRDNTVCLWDAATGQQVGTLQGHRSEVTSLAFLPGGREVVTGSADSTILVWGLPAWKRPAPTALAEKELEALWADLAATDGVKAARAVHALAASSTAVPFLQKRLQPVPAPDDKRIAAFVADLGNKEFAVRQKASSELENFAELAAPALENALAQKPSLETQQRIQALLNKLAGRILPPETLRVWRAIEVLEQTGTPEAHDILKSMAEGAAGATLTRDARRALRSRHE